jgi:thymidylate kinase
MTVKKRPRADNRSGANGPSPGQLIAVDGLNGAAVHKTARARLAKVAKSRRGGVSVWDASGVFADLIVAGPAAGHPSARTLVLLYAADLAFRLRWEIRPALAEGRTVAAAPYVETAIAFGRAAGLPAGWLNDVFSFAIKADATHRLDGSPGRGAHASGFVGFACDRLDEGGFSIARQALTARVRKHLRRLAAR